MSLEHLVCNLLLLAVGALAVLCAVIHHRFRDVQSAWLKSREDLWDREQECQRLAKQVRKLTSSSVAEGMTDEEAMRSFNRSDGDSDDPSGM